MEAKPFNETHHLNITQDYLVELLRVATKHQLFQFNGHLYEQIDGVAMGSPLGPLMANVFLCSIEEKLESENTLPSFYRRYVDDTLATVLDISSAEAFLTTLNEAHPSITFTMETATNNKLPFVGMEIEMKGNQLATRVYRKPTNKGLLLHYQSHVDNNYKRSLWAQITSNFLAKFAEISSYSVGRSLIFEGQDNSNGLV